MDKKEIMIFFVLAMAITSVTLIAAAQIGQQKPEVTLEQTILQSCDYNIDAIINGNVKNFLENCDMGVKLSCAQSECVSVYNGKIVAKIIKTDGKTNILV